MLRTGIDCKGKEYTEFPKELPNGKDITGQVFGELTVLFRIENEQSGSSRWLCQCSCGNLLCARGTSLRSGHTCSCGCVSKKIQSDKLVIEIKPGTKFGYWTVIERAEGFLGKGAYYKVKCKCGTEKILPGYQLRNGYSYSCGCYAREIQSQVKEDLTGKQFGKLTVLERVPGNGPDGVYWRCICECGTIRNFSGHSLKRGTSQSCGCVFSHGERNIKEILDNAKISYTSQQTFEDLRSNVGAMLRYDFAILDSNKNVIRLIEFDGPQHSKPCSIFGGQKVFEETKARDELKNQYAISHNIPLVRIPYSKRDSMTLDDLLGDKYTITKQ